MIACGSGDVVSWVTGSGTTRLYDYLLVSGTQHYKDDKVVATLMSFGSDVNCSGSRSIWVVLNGSCICYE